MKKRCIVCHRKLKKSHGPFYVGLMNNLSFYAEAECKYLVRDISRLEAYQKNWQNLMGN